MGPAAAWPTEERGTPPAGQSADQSPSRSGQLGRRACMGFGPLHPPAPPRVAHGPFWGAAWSVLPSVCSSGWARVDSQIPLFSQLDGGPPPGCRVSAALPGFTETCWGSQPLRGTFRAITNSDLGIPLHCEDLHILVI